MRGIVFEDEHGGSYAFTIRCGKPRPTRTRPTLNGKRNRPSQCNTWETAVSLDSVRKRVVGSLTPAF